jgi:hypothetical protein
MDVLAEHRGRVKALRETLAGLLSFHRQLYQVRRDIVHQAASEEKERGDHLLWLREEAARVAGEILKLRQVAYGKTLPTVALRLLGQVESAVQEIPAEPPPPDLPALPVEEPSDG